MWKRNIKKKKRRQRGGEDEEENEEEEILTHLSIIITNDVSSFK